MSNSVDNKIVKMQLQNSQFTAAANATMSTLKKLGDSLKLTEGTKGLENVANKAKSIDMSGLSQGIETVKSNFSALDIVGVTALVNIANSAVNAGKNIVNSLTLEPIMDGFREYEIKMNAIQTIMTNTASKGSTMDDIKGVLADLNDYSDQTIYNFAQMTDNLGKFTAAGVGLEDSAIAIKGMANVAAGFGVDATRMAGATYQMSQMLASGKMMAQDWNSMVQAGMAGDKLQKALIDTAAAMGTAKSETKSFKDSLEDGWLTSEVFIETMKKMADDQSLIDAATKVKTFTQLIGTMQEVVGSGWATSWEYILGDKEQSTELFTSISKGFENIIGPMTDYRNAALKTWNEAGGRQAVLNGLKNILQSIGNILGPIYQAYKKIIDPWNSDRLISISKGFEKITENLKMTDKAGEYLGKTFRGIFSIFKLVGMVLKPIGSLLTGIVGVGTPISEVFFKMTGSLTGWIENAVKFVESTGAIEKASGFLYKAGQSISDTMKYTYEHAIELWYAGIEKAKLYYTGLVTTLNDLAVAGKEKVSSIVEFVKEFNRAYQPLTKTKDFIVGVFDAIQNGIQSFLDFTKNSINSIRDFFDSIVEKVKDSDIRTIDFVKAGLFASLLVIAKKLLPIIKNFISGVGNFKDSVIGVLDELQNVLTTYQKNIKADTIKKIAVAIGILAASVWVLSTIDPERLLPAVTALGTLIGGVMGAMWAFNKIDPQELKKSASSIVMMIGISIAINNLARALNKLGKLKWDEIVKGVVGLTTVCAMMGGLMNAMEGIKISPGLAPSIMSIATSMWIFAGAMAIIGNLEVSTIFKSLTSMAVILGGLTIFFKAVKTAGNPMQVAASMIPIAMSMMLLSGALAIIGNMDPGTLMQGLTVMATVLTEIGLFSKMISKFDGSMVSMGAGILIISNAMIVLSAALAIIGNMDVVTVIKGLLTLATTLGIFAGAANLMPKNLPVFAGQIMILSGALLVMGAALKVVGGISWGTITKGMAVLAGTMIIFGGAAVLLAPTVPVMGALALGLIGLGAAAGLIGGALILLSTGMTMFAGSIIGGSAALVTALMAVASVIPIFSAAVALGLVSFITVLGYNAAAIQRSLIQLIAMLNTTITASIPGFVNTIIVFMSEMMNAIITLTPQIIETTVTVVTSILEALSTNLPLLADLITQFVFELLTTVLQRIAECIPPLGSAVTDVIVSLINVIGDNTGRIVDAGFNMIISVINGITNAISTRMPQVRSATADLVKAIITELKNAVKDSLNIGRDIVDGIKNGLMNGIDRVKEAAKSVASGALNAAKNFLGIHSPSREFFALGDYSNQGLANGMVKNKGLVVGAATKVAESALDSMKSAMSYVSNLITDDIDSSPTIKPVLDLSDIQNGVRNIDSLMESNRAIQLTTDKVSRSFNRNNRESIPQGGIGDTINHNTTEIKNEFNITGSDPHAIASEVSEIIQKQIDRRDVVWA